MPELTLPLESIGSDAIQLVIKFLGGQDSTRGEKCSLQDILPLSEVSKSLRLACLPNMFNEITCRFKSSDSFFSFPHLWQYTRVLKVGISLEEASGDPFGDSDFEDNEDTDVDPVECKSVMQSLQGAFPKMKVLHSCIITRMLDINVEFIMALGEAPSLTSLEFINPTFQENPDIPAVFLSGLSRLIVRHEPWTLRDQLQEEIAYVSAFLLGSQSTLQEIGVPAESIFLSNLEKQDWPCLETFTLSGNQHERSIAPFLAKATHINTLDIQVTRTQSVPFIIFPRADDTDDIPSGNIFRSVLKSLTLNNPSPKDGIFKSIRNVQRLSFPVMPPPSISDIDRAFLLLPTWSATEAKEVLTSCELPYLTELQISVMSLYDDTFFDLITSIATSFPLLEILEIHRYPLQRMRGSASYRFPCDVLTDMKKLKILRLDLNIGLRDDDEDILNSIAAKSFTIESICIFHRYPIDGKGKLDAAWDSYKVIQGPNGPTFRIAFNF